MSTEQKLPKKMGRPPKPGGPMSNKERQQRWRDRVKAEAQRLLKQVQEAK